METITGEIGSGPTIVRSSTSELAQHQLWTKESIDPRISVTLVEIDVQSAQYSCEVTITNAADEEFSVSEVRPRLPKGVTLNEAVDSAQVAAVKRHEEICRAISDLMSSSGPLVGRATSLQDPNNLQQRVLAIFKRSRRVPAWTQIGHEGSKIDVTSAADAESALKAFPLHKDSDDRRFVEYNIDVLKRLEKDADFRRSKSQAISLKKGQQYKAIYIICGAKGALNATSYSISFDIVLRRGDYLLSRVEYVTATVPPAPFWPTVVAMASAAIGSLIQSFGVGLNAASAGAQIAGSADFLSAPPLRIAATLVVPVLTALIVYNIYDMTSLKDRVTSIRSWRSAVFVGFLCGFLNDKILAALGALLQ